MPLRAKVATSVSRTAAALSRAAGRGDGSVIGGWIGLKIDPDLLRNLAAGRAIALVSGTNGKTTTTRLTAAALGVLGPVATNSFGANMPTGHTSALAKAGATPFAVLEVDEHYLARVIDETTPRVVALLNLSRDQLDRAKEVAMMAQMWRTALAAHPDVHVVANADDPMVVWAAISTAHVTWFSAGQRWHDDSWVCPECGSPDRARRRRLVVHRLPAAPPASRSGRSRTTAWSTRSGDWHLVKLQLPGQVNLGNAATALAVAAEFGVRPLEAVPRLATVTSVAGRYAQVERDGRNIRLLLAKNPASWLEAFDMADAGADPALHQRPRPRRLRHLLAVRRRLLPAARPPGADHRRPGVRPGGPARGERCARSGTYVPSTRRSRPTPPGRLEVIANYTAFQDIRAELDRVN